MVTAVDKAVVCPLLLGRARLLDALDRSIEGMASGRGMAVAVAGDAGIGKSRLVAEARLRAAAATDGAALTLQGNCFEPDSSLPYAPILDMLRGCLNTHSQNEITECMGPDAPELVKLLPELTATIPGLAAAPALDPEQEKRRLFHALAQFFTRLAARHPLLIVIEDVHWSDETSLEFLLVLARRAAALPVLLLLTYRSDEQHETLGHALARMERERLLVEWPLTPLGPDDVDRMIRAIFDLETPVRAEFLDAICSLTEGNPFFIEEVLKSLVASGDIYFADGTWDRKPMSELRIPRSVHDAVRVRTAQLSAEAQHVLTVAAVTGRRFDFGLLQRVVGNDEHELLRLVKEMISAQLVVEETADHFAFRHALTQQVIYSDLLARERRALHRTIAENTRRLYAASLDAHLAELAHHFHEGGSWDEAYYYCRRVGENAQTLYASRAAVEHFTRALEAAEHLNVTPPARLLHARGQSYDLLGEFEAALADYERALSIARGAGDGTDEWQALLDLGFLWAGRDYRRAGEIFRRATDLARALGQPTLIATSLNRFGNWLVNTGDTAEGIKAHRDALTVFNELDNDAGRAQTYDLLGMANGLHGDMSACVENYERAVQILRTLDDSHGLASSLASLGTFATPAMHETVEWRGRSMDDCRRDLDEALQLARRISWASGEAFAQFAYGTIGSFGRFGEGLAHAAEALRIATEIEHEQWIIAARFTLGQIYYLMQLPGPAIDNLEAAQPLMQRLGSAWWRGNVASYLALSYLSAGRIGDARSLLAAAMPRDQRPRNYPERRLHWAWGELALAEHDFDDALSVAETLVECAVHAEPPQPIAPLLRLRGRALAGLGRIDEAEAALVAAREGAIEHEAMPWLGPIQRDLAGLYRSAGRSSDADRAAREADAVFEALAATIDDAQLRERFLAAAADGSGAKRRPTARQAEKAAFGGLTTREREVAALIARGRSNRDMAEELVLGERTIETHVGNILSKLGFSSRAQVAAWAVESGLLAHAE